MHRVRHEGKLPSCADIVAEAFKELGYSPRTIGAEEVSRNFNGILRKVWEHALAVLERHEDRSYAPGIARELIHEFPYAFEDAENVARSQGFKAGVLRLFASWYPLLRRCFQSVSQSRMQRGGGDFELEIEFMLQLADVPYERQVAARRTDFVLPNRETHEKNRNISAVVSSKRTLRERWAEVAEELFNLRSPNVFLFTADEDVSKSHVERICKGYNIHLVVWDEIKAARFAAEPLVLGYTQWATERLPVLRQYWR